MNLGEIIKDVRSLIIEPTPGFRSDEELKRWINQAHQELGSLYRIEAIKNMRVTKDVPFYQLPDDLLQLKGAWDSNNRNIPIVPIVTGINNMGDTDNGESPMSLYRYGDLFVLIPPPSGATYINLFYERKPKILTSNEDIPEIPEPYHKYLVAFATMRAFEKDEDYEAASVYSQEYEYGKSLISQHKLPLSQDAQAVFKLMDYQILNPAEAAQYLNLPLKEKVWQRVEVEQKAVQLLSMGVISKEELIKNTVFPDKEDIEKVLEINASDLIPLPAWEDDINGQ